jgi:hypothetical protein
MHRNRKITRNRFVSAIIGVFAASVAFPAYSEEIRVFYEPFEDTNWTSRGWYDGPTMEITSAEKVEGGSSCLWDWRQGNQSPNGRGARVHLDETDNVTLSFYIKHSDNWRWTGTNFHPHEFHFVTTENHEFVGPAYTHLTFYIEVVDGVPVVAIQDGANVDNSRIGQNLVDVTENRSVAGGNGDSDGHGEGDYYLNGGVHWNGKRWDPGQIYFSPVEGDFYRGDWHHIKARFKLNTVVDGVGQRDGILQYWYDGRILMDHDDVVYRTGRFPDMLINQFLMTPYIGAGAKADQQIWVDELMIHVEDGLLPQVEPDLIARSDFTGDGKVDFQDFLSFVSAFGKAEGEPGFNSAYDLTEDGAVTFEDFLQFASVFGRTVV